MITTQISLPNAATSRLLQRIERAEQRNRPSLITPDFWASQSHSTIRTQYGERQFEPFPWQVRFIDGDGGGRTDYEHMTLDNIGEFYPGITRREMTLKSRDVGSSEICVRWYCWLMMRFGGNFLIKADVHDNAKNLVAIARQYLTSLPEGERPKLLTDNETELELEKIGSVIAVAKGRGRSERCLYLLKTERAFWANAAEEEANISGTLVAGGWLTQESTANGFNDYHTDWVDDTNGYRKTFVGRHDNPTHDAQWWKEKVDELAKKGKTLEQEYPATPEEAFVASGKCVFEIASIQEAQRDCKSPIEQRLNGALSIWVKPVVAGDYVMGVDVAEGLDIGNDQLDYSHAAVYDRRQGKHVASIHGQWAPDVWAQMVYDLGKLYGWAYIGVERNNHGLTVLTTLRALKYPDNRLFWETSPEEAVSLRHEGKKGNAIVGWRTTGKSKPILESDFGAAIRSRDVTSYDSRLWDECLTYVHHGDGSRGAQEGCHDDRVLAHMIAWQMRKYGGRAGNSIVAGTFKMGR